MENKTITLYTACERHGVSDVVSLYIQKKIAAWFNTLNLRYGLTTRAVPFLIQDKYIVGTVDIDKHLKYTVYWVHCFIDNDEWIKPFDFMTVF